MDNIARLTPVPLRELWRHEAFDFTRWLADNLDYLEEITGMKLSLVESEASAGDFSVDILAEDGTGNLVVIENQIEKTDHDHLGKLLTYMSNLEAKTAIWIASQPRPEHEKAVHWLNEILPADTAIFLLQIEVYRIADSPPAPKFTVIAGPSEESRQVGSRRKELAERHRLRIEFWEQLQAKLKEKKINLHANISPSKDHWISTGAGKSGLTFTYVILKDAGRVELYIDTQDQETNKRYFDQLYAQKDKIEAEFGAPLEWQRLNGKRASRIAYTIRERGGLKNKDSWPELQDEMIGAMVHMSEVLAPCIRELH